MLELYSLNYGYDELGFKSELRAREVHPFYSQDMKSLHILSEEEYWNNKIDSVKFDFLAKTELIHLQNKQDINYNTFLKFQEAIDDYIKDKKIHNYIKEISKESAKNFLYLIPTIDSYSPNITIDADTGCVNITFTTNDNGLLSALITAKSEIHYSRVSRDMKIYKISGIAKIKDTRDFHNFSKILRML